MEHAANGWINGCNRFRSTILLLQQLKQSFRETNNFNSEYILNAIDERKLNASWLSMRMDFDACIRRYKLIATCHRHAIAQTKTEQTMGYIKKCVCVWYFLFVWLELGTQASVWISDGVKTKMRFIRLTEKVWKQRRHKQQRENLTDVKPLSSSLLNYLFILPQYRYHFGRCV